MTIKIPDPNNEGAEIEVYTAEEVTARETAAKTEVEGIWKPQLVEATEKLTDAEKRAAERAGEFANFRKLSDEQVAKLTVAERTIYENTLLLQAEKDKNIENDKKVYDAAVDATIRAKVGNDPKLFEKAKAMYKVIGLEDATPEQMQQRATAAVGALVQTEPDLLAVIGVSSSGSYMPPVAAAKDDSFAATERGKAGAAELGLIIEAPKKE